MASLYCRAQAVGAGASVVAARELSRCGSEAVEARAPVVVMFRLRSSMTWDLPQPVIELIVLCIGLWTLIHCTARKVRDWE